MSTSRIIQIRIDCGRVLGLGNPNLRGTSTVDAEFKNIRPTVMAGDIELPSGADQLGGIDFCLDLAKRVSVTRWKEPGLQWIARDKGFWKDDRMRSASKIGDNDNGSASKMRTARQSPVGCTIETSGLPSGVYFYKLETPVFSRTSKMVVLK